MNFYSIRDLRSNSKNMWNSLAEGEEIVITNNGKPSAIIIDIPDDNFEETLQAVRQAKAMIVFNNMRSRAAKQGFLSDEEIESEIEKARKEE